MKKNIYYSVCGMALIFIIFSGCATVDQQAWQKARQADSFEGYGEYIVQNPRGSHVNQARAEIAKSYMLSDEEVNQVVRLQKENPTEARRALYIDKLMFTAAACLDKDANWADLNKGRKLYNLLQQYDSHTLSNSMVRVVLIQIDRLRVLFLIVKLGVSGTQNSLNGLLMRYGDKKMAEDFLNCGSPDLHSGGEAWGRAHGYHIRTGPGSHRVGWGRF
jgi:hypothetical protein